MLCTLADERLDEVSGLVIGPDGPVVVNDSGNPSTLYRVDPDGEDCEIVTTVPVSPAGVDVEDLALADDGTWWLADIGDNRAQRETVAMLRIGPDSERVDVALTYADGPRDAEALLLGADDRPVIVTKDGGGRSGVYTTEEPLHTEGSLPVAEPDEPVILRRRGEVVVPPTVTAGGDGVLGVVGRGLITGGAVSPDGTVAALRTYTDAWLYPVAPGPTTAESLVAALRERPVQVPLPGEPQGEAIAFDADGTLHSASESPAQAPSRGLLRAVPGVSGLVGDPVPAESPAAPPASPAASAPPRSVGPTGWTPWIGAGIAVVVGGAGVLLVLRRRRR